MKSKKTLTSVAVLVVALAIFAISTFAAAGNLSAYQKLKDNLISAMNSSDSNGITKIDSISSETNIKTSIDGAEVMSMNSINKTNGENHSSVNEITEYGITKTTSSESILKDNKIYNVNRGNDGVASGYVFDVSGYIGKDTPSNSYTAQPSDSQTAFVSSLIDTVVGDAKNYFYDNGDVIGLKLEGGQIPELIQLGINAAMESSREDNKAYPQEQNKSINYIMSLNNLRVASIKGEMASPFEIQNTNANGELVLSGIDATGKMVNISVTFETKVYDIGNTVVEASSWEGIEFSKDYDFTMENQDIMEDIEFEYDKNSGAVVKIG